MKTALRRYLTPPLAGLILMGGFTGRGQSAVAGSPETSLTVTIHVYNYAEVDHKTLMKAEKVATGIFRKAGVESQWADHALSSENKRENSADQGSSNLSHLQLMILPRSMAERLGLPSYSMGLTPGKEQRDRQQADVFYHSVEALAVRLMRERTEGSIRPYTTMDQILGHTMAHEIGHLLLNLKSHSATGIMRGDWSLKDLQDANNGCLLFTPQQAEVIRAEVGRRVRQQKAPEVAELESPELAR